MIFQQTTKELLAESLKDLAQKKPVDKITIKELTKNCGLTSPTFYNHFRNTTRSKNITPKNFFQCGGKFLSEQFRRDCTGLKNFCSGRNFFLCIEQELNDSARPKNFGTCKFHREEEASGFGKIYSNRTHRRNNFRLRRHDSQGRAAHGIEQPRRISHHHRRNNRLHIQCLYNGTNLEGTDAVQTFDSGQHGAK